MSRVGPGRLDRGAQPGLKRLYAATEGELVSTVEDFLASAQFHVEQREAVQAATQLMRSLKKVKVGFTDLLVVQIAKNQACAQTVNFDTNAVRSAGMTLLV